MLIERNDVSNNNRQQQCVHVVISIGRETTVGVFINVVTFENEEEARARACVY